MLVLALTDCPPALRGDLTLWLQEIATNVFVGQVSARVRDKLWDRVCENVKTGRATMVFSTNNEQRMSFRVHNADWEPIDFDGLKLMLRPSPARIRARSQIRTGFSNAAKMHKARQMASRNRRHAPLPKDYVVVDVETTGLSITQDEIIEIGAILVKGRTVERKFHALIKPAGSVPAPVQALTGITDELLARKGRGLAEVLREFLSFVGELPVVSHNIDFDYGFLRAACTRCHLPPLTNRYVDTLALSKRHVNEVDNYKLATLAGYFGIEVTKAHRSLDDCCVTKQLYEKLNELRLMQE